MKLYYSPLYVGSAHAFDTTRKAKWIADSLAAAPLRGVELVEPDVLTVEQVLTVHDSAYVEAVRSGTPGGLAESQGFPWDPELWSMVSASNGGAVAAALSALQHGVAGSLSSGLHHARYDHGAGFCTFNGLILAAHAALAAGASSVLILDLDAHCGGGTASLLGSHSQIRQIDISVNGFDSYESGPPSQLTIVSSADDYLPEITRQLAEITGPALPELCLYNAGMDPHEDCTTGGLPGITLEILAERERCVFDWCRKQAVPIAFVLAGGYIGPRLDRAGLVELHRLTLEAAVRRED